MATSYDVIARAAKEIGYSRFTDPLMGTIYGRWYALLTNTPWFGTNGVPYCAMFVSYILAECGVEVPGFPTASCLAALSGARGAGIVLANKYDARPGDIVLFDWDPQLGNGVDHVGFVERNCGSYIQTIEGNTSPGTSGSQGNGGGVHRRTRSWGVVAAIIRPNYDGVPSSSKSEAGGGISEDGWWGQ
ncbi:CHAP domain-containing protein, partial [Collinsella sp. AGMB00827]